MDDVRTFYCAMIKMFLSPLFTALVVLWLLQLCMLHQNWRRGWRLRAVCLATLFFPAVITLFSLTAVNNLLRKDLEIIGSYEIACPQNTVVVLGGGYLPSENPTLEELNGESALRVIKGVEVFKKCGANLLIVSGREKIGRKERHAELMRNVAVRLGVPEDHILMEVDSTNTREHAICLNASGRLDRGSRISVVTSPWHLRRAMGEFKRYYDDIKPVAAYDMRSAETLSARLLPPNATALNDSVTLVHEYIGSMWYQLLNRYPQLSSGPVCDLKK